MGKWIILKEIGIRGGLNNSIVKIFIRVKMCRIRKISPFHKMPEAQNKK